MITLSTALQSAVVACAEVLINDTSAWARALGVEQVRRLAFAEVEDLLLSVWETGAGLLPETVGDPARMQWAAPPTTELRLSAEQPGPTGVLLPLSVFINLQPLGPASRSDRSEMAVTVTAAPAMGRKQRYDVLRRALVYMARAFGHVEAGVELL